MKLKLLVVLAAMGMATNAMAVDDCKFIPATPAQTINSESILIQLSANAEVSTTNPIGSSIAPASLGGKKFRCENKLELWGTRDITNGSLRLYPGNPDFYETNLKGIGVRFYAIGPTSLAGAVKLPQISTKYNTKAPEPGDTGIEVDISPSRFVAHFYKLEKNIDLRPNIYQQKVNIMTPQIIGDSKVEGKPFLIYNLGNIELISVPVCTVDQPQKIDFGTVTADNVRDGASKDLKFGMLCHTDYGSYNAVASINAANRTPDGKFIAVTDVQGNSDSLIIEITDLAGQQINVDGSTSRDVLNVSSGDKAKYEWKAILKQANGKPAPARGRFKASAIITLDLK
ncbi:MAG TPA: hypothetical protein DIT05_05610 [Morganella sp. (in: Bacteria)]|nr:hypothetical protein [Morganella sp. (in: enterobacteria)]